MSDKQDRDQQDANNIQFILNYLDGAFHTTPQSTDVNIRDATLLAAQAVMVEVMEEGNRILDEIEDAETKEDLLNIDVSMALYRKALSAFRQWHGDYTVAKDRKGRAENLSMAISQRTGMSMSVKKPGFWGKLRGKREETTFVPQTNPQQ